MQFCASLHIDVLAPLSIMPVLWFFVSAAGLCVRERMSECGCFTGIFVNNVVVKIEEAWQVDCEIKNACRPAWLTYSPVWFLLSVLVATATCTGRSLDIFHVWKKTVSKINFLFDARDFPSAFGRVVKQEPELKKEHQRVCRDQHVITLRCRTVTCSHGHFGRKVFYCRAPWGGRELLLICGNGTVLGWTERCYSVLRKFAYGKCLIFADVSDRAV
jgi:hypothetical protein